ncbi:NAD(P)-binding protein [Microthyrium microscopicum]|uniref:NAD(P)-binding protein n=1 Tax=Microthyrium microscopicum TaxID=703497 RepID=A0A6A6U1Y2_9PEZI|nr:NAD(P)-binding protein [Microthyrium microscopicum]
MSLEGLSPEVIEQLFNAVLPQKNVTPNIHREPYPAVSPTRPELSQAGKAVLVTGGGTGVGYSIAQSFVRAAADTVIIIGRRESVIAEAASKLEKEAKSVGTGTKIISRSLDATDLAKVDAFWNDLAAQGVNVDVYVANAAKFSDGKSILELGFDEVWSQIETNTKSPLYFVNKFCAQPGDKKKYIVNVSTQAIHLTTHPQIANRPAYTLSKTAGTLLFQLIAQTEPSEKLQVISYHPGIIYGDEFEKMGLPAEIFDNVQLCGDFAVWAASEEAEFLHGRFVWAGWDVDDLANGEARKRIDSDPFYLRSSVVGV